MADALNTRRVNVWQSHAVAVEAASDDAASRIFRRMTIYPTEDRAVAHRHHDSGGGASSNQLTLGSSPLTLGSDQLVLGA